LFWPSQSYLTGERPAPAHHLRKKGRTLSGAPKIRAMEIIHELEPRPRGAYGGSVGYISYDGNMDMAITIRTLEARNGKVRVQAGAGIVYDSIPASEYQETINKATALFRSVEFAGRNLK
jgi:anthranilate synthase component 1